MQPLDLIVLAVYFLVVIAIGIACSRRVKAQDDFFMGHRSFGKLLQTFAAFGAGTSANEPIQVGRTTWTSGLSGIWSVLMWLFVTPFYWNLSVWFRRLRLMTTGEFFVERYQSRAMGAAYTAFGFCFYFLFLSASFSAISKVAVPLLGEETVRQLGYENPENLKYLLIPVIAAVTAVYGAMGGLKAAYWTDLFQGVCIIALSLILIPYGLDKLVTQFGDPSMSLVDGFSIMHDRVTDDYFKIVGGPRAGEFPLHFIVSLTLLGLVGIVVHPHMITVGGGAARTETSARIGLVTGSFMKRFCTIGWALTALIVLALMADNVEAARDPDHVWGIACREILGPLNLGLVGLMLASLLAALMSSADCYMITSAALLVRNVYAPYFNPNASEKVYVRAGRLASLVVIVGGALVSIYLYDVFEQFKLTMELPIIFAAPFWLGMFWRRSGAMAAWITIIFSATLFFIVPIAAPLLMPSLRENPTLQQTNHQVVVTVTREAKAADVAKWQAWNKVHDAAEAIADDKQRAKALDTLPKAPPEATLGEPFVESFKTGGKSIYWTGKLVPTSPEKTTVLSTKDDHNSVVVTQERDVQFVGQGRLNVDMLLYRLMGVDLESATDAGLATLRMPLKLVLPFIVMILATFFTRRNDSQTLDRFYAKMRVPVDCDPEEDEKLLQRAYEDPAALEHRKLFPGTECEIEKPRFIDIFGFLVCLGICFAFVCFAIWVTGIGM